MPFNYLGTMREMQWRFFRNWTLNERRSVSARLRYINAELIRIGRITVFYEEQKEEVETGGGAVDSVETVNEKRTAFFVSRGTSLEKLVQAYIAQGGNPMSISMFLIPDEVQFTTEADPIESEEDNPNEVFTDVGAPSLQNDQPYQGMVAPRTATSLGPSGRHTGGLPTFIRDVYTLAGQYFDQADANAKIAIKLDYGRRWAQQNLMELARLEHQIMKLMDTREQLIHERDNIVQQAVGGSVADFPFPPDPRRYARNAHLTNTVAEMDSVFYETTEEGEPDFGQILTGDGDNPEGISKFFTLFDNPDGTDPFAHG